VNRKQDILLSCGMLNERLAELELAERVVDSLLELVAKAREERDWPGLEGLLDAGRGMARSAAEAERIAAETAAGVRRFVG
jgi:hypothetical protein